MIERQVISAIDVQEALALLEPYFSEAVEIHNFHVDVKLGSQTIAIDMVSSPGGGFEGGYSTTQICSVVPINSSFEFVVYPDDFLNKIGKLFGMEDTLLGYPEFDDRLIVKTTNKERLRILFSEEASRSVLSELSGFSLRCHFEHQTEHQLLDFQLQRAATDFNEFTLLLSTFVSIYQKI